MSGFAINFCKLDIVRIIPVFDYFRITACKKKVSTFLAGHALASAIYSLLSSTDVCMDHPTTHTCFDSFFFVCVSAHTAALTTTAASHSTSIFVLLFPTPGNTH